MEGGVCHCVSVSGRMTRSIHVNHQSPRRPTAHPGETLSLSTSHTERVVCYSVIPTSAVGERERVYLWIERELHAVNHEKDQAPKAVKAAAVKTIRTADEIIHRVM